MRPTAFYRWMASPAIDRIGNIGDRLFVRRHAAFRRAAVRRAPAPAIRQGQLTLEETVLVEGEACADQHDALGGLHDDGDGSDRRLHDLVRRRLHQEGRRDLLEPDRRVPDARLPLEVMKDGGCLNAPTLTRRRGTRRAGRFAGRTPGAIFHRRAAARIKIDVDRTIGTVDPLLFGNFAEHLGRMIYGGIYDEGSPLSDPTATAKTSWTR